MVFYWSLSYSKSSQVSRTLLSILAVFKIAVVWMVSTRPPTSKSPCPFNSTLVTVPNAPITIGIIVMMMFHSFVYSLTRSWYSSFFSRSFSFFCGQPVRSTILQVLFFYLLITIRSGLLAEIRWSVCISMSHRSLCVSYSRTAAGLWLHHLFVWSNLKLLHISQWITLATQSCLVLHSFCENFSMSLLCDFVGIITLLSWVFQTSVKWLFVSGFSTQVSSCFQDSS